MAARPAGFDDPPKPATTGNRHDPLLRHRVSPSGQGGAAAPWPARGCAKMEGKGGSPTSIDESLAEFIADQRSSIRPTVNVTASLIFSIVVARRGFWHVLDEKTLAFATSAVTASHLAPATLPTMRRRCDPHGLREPHAREDLGHGARGRGRSPLTAKVSPGATRRGPSRRSSVHHRGLGRELPATYPADALAEDVAEMVVERYERAHRQLEVEMLACVRVESASPLRSPLDLHQRVATASRRARSGNAPSSSATMKLGASAGATPANVSPGCARRRRRIGEGGGGGEPRGGGDESLTAVVTRVGLEAEYSRGWARSPERGDELATTARFRSAPSSRAASRSGLEHQMREHGTDTSPPTICTTT